MASKTDKAIAEGVGQQLNETAVRDLVKNWYQLLDVHAPETDLVPLLSETGLEMQFPEGPLHGLDDFRRWYETVTHTFFDEKHVLKEVNVTLAADRADVNLIVNWQASRWKPPSAQTDRLGFDAYQRWTVTRNAAGRPVIVSYIVDRMVPMEKSVALDGSVALWPRFGADDARQLALRYFNEILTAGALDVVDQIMTSDVVFNIPTIPGGVRGSEGYKNFLRGLRNAFPDGVFSPLRNIAEGEKAAVMWTFRGTQKGEFLGVPPTNKVVTDYGIDILHFAGGKIREIWANEDALGLMQQLGAIPSSGSTAQANLPGPGPQAVAAGNVEQNKQLVERYFKEIMNSDQPDAAINALIAPDCVFTIPTLPEPFYGPDGYRNLVRLLRTAFPDLVFTSLDVIAEGDTIAERWSASGTSQGDFAGAPPTGKRFIIEGIGWYRLSGGKFVENRVNEDSLGLLQQIGALPGSGGPSSANASPPNVQLVERFWEEIWNQGKFEIAEEIVSQDFVLYLPAGEMRGPAGLKQWATMIRTGLPDVKFTIEQLFADGPTVVTRWSAKGTHTGFLLGYPPTHKPVRMSGISIFQIADQRIIEDRAAEDALGLLQQIGMVLPPPGPGSVEALVLMPGEGRAISSLGSTMTIKCSAKDTYGLWSLTHLTVPPNFVQQAPPPHYHTRDEEAFYVTEGTITFEINGKPIKAPAGSFVKFPRNLVHKFSNPSDQPAAVLVVGAPAGIEEYLVEIYEFLAKPGPPDPAKLGEIFNRYGLVISQPTGT